MKQTEPLPKIPRLDLQDILEYGELEEWWTIFKPTWDRRDFLRKKIQACHDDSPANQAYSIDTEDGTLVVGEKANVREIVKMSSLARHLGRSFFALCSFTLKNLDAHVPVTVRAKFLKETQTGPRTVKWIPRLDTDAQEAFGEAVNKAA